MFFSSLLAALVSTAVTVGALPQGGNVPVNCARTAIVQPGDTCDMISAANRASTFQLANVNMNQINAACSNLFPGQTVCLGIAGQDCQIVHVVQPGENCLQIAQNEGTTLQMLFANNPNINAACTNIYPGQVLCTANELFVM